MEMFLVKHRDNFTFTALIKGSSEPFEPYDRF
jgi:hypothetical protein